MSKSIKKATNLEIYKKIKKSFNNIKTNIKGITLIALIVTIIVLLILAGISISMLTGDNGILRKTTEAKQVTEKSSAKEQIQTEVLGSFDTTTKPNLIVLKNRLSEIGTEIKNSDFPLYVIFKGNEFIISENGEMIDLSGGNTTNLIKMQAEISEITDVDAKIAKYREYYGKTVNYPVAITTAATYNGTTETEGKGKWKIFYMGENNIYLISDSVVTYDSLPKDSDTLKYTKSNANNLYNANFSNAELCSKYSGGTTYINGTTRASTVKLLNKDFFYKTNTTTGELEDNLTGAGYESMKAVASMLDTDFWDKSFKDNKGYAEYTIGGPTIEMLFASYNQTHKDVTTGQNLKYGAKAYAQNESVTNTETNEVIKLANYDGYKMNKDKDEDRTSNNWKYSIITLSTDVEKIYVDNIQNYWLASPSAETKHRVLFVFSNGYLYYADVNSKTIGFRPLVCLKSNVLLKELPEGSDYDFELSF